jgi:nucleotide-binding universal stress UspA family protein
MGISRSRKKILVPLDGSDRSLGTVRYIAKIEPFRRLEVVLFHVFSGVPECYWDLAREPKSVRTVPQVRAWEREQKKRMQDYMQKAKEILLREDFSSENVRVRIQQRKKGIARDILREAQEGYKAVVARRRGMGALRGLVLGSVASKLLAQLSFLPLLMAGRKPPGNKILLAFDGSEGSMQAVDFVASTLGGFDFKVRLIHVIRGKQTVQDEDLQIYSPRECTETAQAEIIDAFDEAKIRLMDAGFKANRLSTKIIKGVSSRAGAIVNEAKNEGFGTIVLGRRGLSRVRQFLIGRVTNKVVHLARDRTVWIIR